MLTLYNFPQSTCSQKVRLVLWEKNLPFADHIVQHKTREHLSDWYLKLNPNGVVPTLKHDDAVIIDSSVIMEYLDEVFPDTPMVPRDAVGRAHVRKWLRYFEEVPTAALFVAATFASIAVWYPEPAQKTSCAQGASGPVRDARSCRCFPALPAALRAHGLAAAYVSGYIRTVHSKEEIELRGADASHAWVAVWCGEQVGWVHLDPTNDLVAKEDPVAVSWGRDFSDVSPLRGVILGGDSHSYGVAVTLVPTN